jgi:hypothetical protein
LKTRESEAPRIQGRFFIEGEELNKEKPFVKTAKHGASSRFVDLAARESTARNGWAAAMAHLMGGHGRDYFEAGRV